MRKLLLFIISFAIGFQSMAQCVPDAALTHSGLLPSVLPDAKVGTAYSQVISFQFPTDTQLTIFGSLQNVHIDTVIIQSLTGFPASFTKACNNANCKYYGTPLRGCMQINGTPAIGDTGTRKLYVTVIAKLTIAGGLTVPYPVVDSSITFTVKNPTGLSRGAQTQTPVTFGIEQITPNPFSDKTVITITSPKAEKVTVQIRDILGKLLFEEAINCKAGNNNYTLITEDLKPGYYLISVTNSTGVKTKKITKR